MTVVGSPLEADPAALTPSFPVLDSMRAVGSLAVVATHTSFWAGAYAHGFWGTALARLDFGVAIFFVLSGFLLSRPHIARAAHGLRRPSAGRYFWKRGLRVLPVYWVAAATALILLPENASAGWDTWLRTLTLTDIYVSPALPAGLSQMWSLATEVAFYTVLPLMMMIGLPHGELRRTAMTALLLLMFLVNILWIQTLAPEIAAGGMVMQWLPSFLTWFGAGIAIAWAHVEWQRSRQGGRLVSVIAELGRAPGVCWTGALSLFAVASTPLTGPTLLVPPTLGEALTKNLLYAAAAALLILPGVFTPGSDRYARWMSWPPLRHLGHISYSIFCIHLVVLDSVVRLLDYKLFSGGGLTLFLVTAIASIAVAELLYRLVEMPVMRLRGMRPPRRLSATRTQTSDASTRH